MTLLERLREARRVLEAAEALIVDLQEAHRIHVGNAHPIAWCPICFPQEFDALSPTTEAEFPNA